MKSFGKIRAVWLSAVAIFVAACLTGCAFFDLGDYENDDAYYDAFPFVRLLEGKNESNYLVRDAFYNEDVIRHLESSVPAGHYTLFSLPFNDDKKIDSLSLYIKSETDAQIHIRLYKDLPDPPAYDDEVPEGEDPSPLPEGCLAERTMSLKAGKWSSFSFGNFGTAEHSSSTLSVEDGESISLLFTDNTRWGKELSYQQCEFTLTALLVRAVG